MPIGASKRRRTNRIATALSWACLCMLGRADAADGAKVEYDFATNENMTYNRSVKPGDEIEVSIANLCEGFEVSYFGLKPEPKPAPKKLREDEITPPWECIVSATPKTVFIPHLSKFGGYVVLIQRKAGPLRALVPDTDQAYAKYREALTKIVAPRGVQEAKPEEKEKAAREVGELKTLGDVTLVISVDQPGWEYELSGGFSSVWRTDPQFAIVEDDAGASVVARELDKEDNVKLGAAAFVNVTHPKWRWGAVSLGLGVNNGSQLSLFFGPSFRMGGKAFLTAGWNWGSVNRLPNGVELDKPAPIENALSNLPTQVKGGFFVGLSYAFLSPGESVLKRPLAPPETPAASQP